MSLHERRMITDTGQSDSGLRLSIENTDTAEPDRLPVIEQAVDVRGETECMPYTAADTKIYDDCPPPPSMLRPREIGRAANAVQTDEAVFSPQATAGAQNDDECSPPPSMLRPRQPADGRRGLPKIPEDRGDCSPPPSLLRPRPDKIEILSSMPLPDTPGYASLQVRVTTGRKSLPVKGACVTVICAEPNESKSETTGEDGNIKPIIIPLNRPSSSCTVEVEAEGFCSARYVRVPLCAGIPAVRQVDLIELPPGHKSDLLILYDNPPAQSN